MIIFKENDYGFSKLFELSKSYREPFIYPTDTIFGIGASCFDEEANKKIYEIKGRKEEKPFIVLIGELSQLDYFVDRGSIGEEHYKILKKFWPGRFTFILPAKRGLPGYLVRDEKVAIRMPDYSLLVKTLKNNEPVTSTSVNLSGGKNLSDFDSIVNKFREKVNLFLYKKECILSKPSTIIDISNVTDIRFIRNPYNLQIKDIIK